MGKWLSMSNTLVWVLTIFFSAYGGEKSQPRWDKVGLDLIWPASFCNLTGCKTIKEDFSIESLVPLYSTPNNGEVNVPPYSKETRCISELSLPYSWKTITESSMGEIFYIMHNRWADLQDRENDTRNVENWRSIWKLYGQCFGKIYPKEYFRTGLELEKPIKLWSIFREGGCRDGFGYEQDKIKRVLHTALQVYATVFCYTNKEGDVLLVKVRICYDKKLERISCRRRFYKCGVGNIMFPASPRRRDNNNVLCGPRDCF